LHRLLHIRQASHQQLDQGPELHQSGHVNI
jgi:hypothetical protein